VSSGGGSGGLSSSITVRPPGATRSENEAVTRIVSLPSCSIRAVPVAMRRPPRATSVWISTAPDRVGRRKNAETTSGSGIGSTRASARSEMPRTYPPLGRPPITFQAR
jgi:hypothetical protein